jgi:hypothetical protein
MQRFSQVLPGSWSVLFFLTVAFVYLYVFMEWIFFVTKPSFMSGMSLWAQVNILLLSALGLSIFPALVILLLGLTDRMTHRKSVARLFVVVGISIPALILSSLLLLLIDNFTYTVFKFGIVSTERFSRASYALLFVVLCSIVYLKLRGYVLSRSTKKYPVKQQQWMLTLGLLTLSLLFVFASAIANRADAGLVSAAGVTNRDLPNIILLGSDGLDANHLSAYGYERDTTPHINQRLDNALVIENAFPNGGTTAGSIASILTGKLPLETGVIYPPDILQGQDSYQHLPGILKRMGYHTVDLSVPYFGDALTLNMQEGFDIANERSGTDTPLVSVARVLGGGDSAYFVYTMSQRLSDRLLHILFLKPMTNPYEAVIQPAERSNEQNRFNNLISTLRDSEQPVFAHVHMLGTHGPRFEIREQVFSAGQTQDKDWMMDFYDDAILAFDQYVGELFDYLTDSGTLENTIVIVYSDHGMQWKIHQRMPLLFWFPQDDYQGGIQSNVQNIDIAPTLLSYLGIPVPVWMEGQSLIAENLKAPKYIFSASVESNLIDVTGEGLWAVEAERRKPPFYQLGYIGLVACNQWYELYVQEPSLHYGSVTGHAGPCESTMVPAPAQAKEILLDHLFQHGYDIFSFPASIPMQHIE